MPVARRALLTASLLVVPALAGCGSENTRLIDEGRAERLIASVELAGRATTRGECDDAERAVSDAQTQVQALPQRVDDRLQQNLEDWLGHLEERIPQDCEATEATPAPTVAPELTPEATETAAPTPSATPTPTASPTPGATEPPAETPTPGAEQPEDGSGVPGGEDGGEG